MIPRLLVLGLLTLGATSFAAAQEAPAVQIMDNDRSSYHQALLKYKAGDFQGALDACAEDMLDTKGTVLKSKILTELKRFDEGEKLLRLQLSGPDTVEIQEALGDLLLRKRSFSRAAKYFNSVLTAKPNDPDVKLKLIYADIGGSDLLSAGKLASQLSPFDPKNPYDDHASYYFAQAALAQASGKTEEAQEQIQAARTNYGVTVTNRYLRTFLPLFSESDKTPADVTTPAPRVKPTTAPTGAATNAAPASAK